MPLADADITAIAMYNLHKTDGRVRVLGEVSLEVQQGVVQCIIAIVSIHHESKNSCQNHRLDSRSQ